MDFWHILSRNFRFCFRNKWLTSINIAGLGIGLAVTMFLWMYLDFELSYDSGFKDAGRIYRMLSVWEEDGEKENLPLCLKELGERLGKDIPGVEEVAQLYQDSKVMSKWEGVERFNFQGYQVDPSFFRIFDFEKVYGNLDGIFSTPSQCVLTLSAAEKLFGKGSDPTGKFLNDGGGEPCRIVAVIADLPGNTHFRFDYLTNISAKVADYGGLEFFTYLKIQKGIDVREAKEKCNLLNKKLLTGAFSDESKARFGSVIEPLTSLHTSTLAYFDLTPTNKLSGLIFVILVGILVLGIALSNFISLFMIQGEKRSLEVGIRKVGGASRGKIARMLLGETFLITFFAFILAIALFVLLSGWLSGLLNISIPPVAWQVGETWLQFIVFYLVTALCAGLYPAWNLSRYRPAELIGKSVVRKFRLTVASVIIQFSIVIFCISALWVILKQLDYVMKQPFGYETKDIMCYYVGMNQIQGKSIIAELSKYPFILDAGIAQSVVEDEASGAGIRRPDQSGKEESSVDEHRIGVGYLETLGIPLLAGHPFSGNIENDRSGIILSEAVVKSLQLQEPVVGKKVLRQGEEFTVVGVAGDTRYGSARRGIGKVVYTSYSDSFYRLYVRFEPGKREETAGAVKAVLSESFPGTQAEMSYLCDTIAYNYAQDQIMVRTLRVGVVLAVILALLGLVALCGFVARQKSKEISIRRISGADVDDIIGHMVRYILLRIIPAVPVGVMGSYWVMDNWLNQFKFAIVIPWWIYGITIAIILFSVTVVVIFRSWETATANPVKALKSK